MKKQWRAIALDETEYWIDDRLRKLCDKIYGVYAYNPNIAYHLCEFTPSYELMWIGTVPCYDYEKLTEEDRDYVFDTILQGDRYSESFTNMHCDDVEKHKHILLGPETALPKKDMDNKNVEEMIFEMWDSGWLENELYMEGLLQ